MRTIYHWTFSLPSGTVQSSLCILTYLILRVHEIVLITLKKARLRMANKKGTQAVNGRTPMFYSLWAFGADLE